MTLDEFYQVTTATFPGYDRTVSAVETTTWTNQLNIAVYNVGDVLRKPYQPGTRKAPAQSSKKKEGENYAKSVDGRYNTILKLIGLCPAHIIMVCEASGITSDAAKPFLRHDGREWQLVSSLDTNLAIGIREAPGATIKVIYDSTDVAARIHRDYKDDAAPKNPADERTLWYLIAEINFGYVTEQALRQGYQTSRPVSAGDPLERASVTTVRVCVFHLDNEIARAACVKARKRLRQMFADCIRFQVDAVGGDANAASYRVQKAQAYHNPRGSSFSIMLARAVSAVNKQAGNQPATIEQCLGAQLLTSNTTEHLSGLKAIYERNNADEITNYADYDCIVLAVFSWGQSHKEKEKREASKVNTGIVHFKNDQDQEDSRPASAEGQLKAHVMLKPGLGPYTWHVRVQQYPMMLTNKHVWLNEGDGAWHHPLVVFLKHTEHKNKRIRSAQAMARRKAKRGQWGYSSTGQEEEEQQDDTRGWPVSADASDTWWQPSSSAGSVSADTSSTWWHSRWQERWK